VSDSAFLLSFVLADLAAALVVGVVALLCAWRGRARVRAHRIAQDDFRARQDEAARWQDDLLALRREIDARDGIIRDLREDSLAYRLGYEDGARGRKQEGVTA
jgi:hypothetical protein